MAGMQIRFLGHAGFEVQSPGGVRVLMDPGLSGHGVFLRSWFAPPDPSFLAERTIASLDPARDCLYLSHHHRDHFDRPFLRSEEVEAQKSGDQLFSYYRPRGYAALSQLDDVFWHPIWAFRVLGLPRATADQM